MSPAHPPKQSPWRQVSWQVLVESLVMWCGSGSKPFKTPGGKKNGGCLFPQSDGNRLFWPIPMCLVYQGMWRLPIGHVTSWDFYLPYKTSKQPWYTCIPDDTTQTNRKFRWVTTWDVPSWQQHDTDRNHWDWLGTIWMIHCISILDILVFTSTFICRILQKQRHVAVGAYSWIMSFSFTFLLVKADFSKTLFFACPLKKAPKRRLQRDLCWMWSKVRC